MSSWFGWAPWAKPRGRQPRPPPLDQASRLFSSSWSRSRSSSPSPKRRSSQLKSADRLARQEREEKEKELEQERLRFMGPTARAAYSEQKKLKHEQRIQKLKAKFASRMKKFAEKHQEKVAEDNRGWKRKREDDAVAQAAERRRNFLENRGKELPAPQSAKTNIERERHRIPTMELFEKIYADLQYHFLHPTLINSDSYDPYDGFFSNHSGVYLRFLLLAQSPEVHMKGIGIESACVLMLSRNFRTALRHGELPDRTFAKPGEKGYSYTCRWDEFQLKLQLEHFSIRGFAIARHIPYMKVFGRSGSKMFGGDVWPANLSLQLDPSIRDPFEVCLGGDGTVYPCLFTPLPLPGESESVHQGVFKLPFTSPKENAGKGGRLGSAKKRIVPLRFQNLKANIFNREIFEQYAPPSTWPPSWEYPPADIQHPCREWGKNYPLCVACGLRTGPLEVAEVREKSEESQTTEEADAVKAPGKKSICRCRTIDVFNRILVEIREYHSECTSKTSGSVDRGVRILQKVPRGHIISEVLGEFIPLGAESAFQCPSTSSVDFHAPPVVDKFGKVLEIDPDVVVKKTIDTNTEPIATLITGHKGGWTTAINKGTSQTSNVEFRSEVWAGKLRITVRALRDINFGEQLFVGWGDSYLEPDGQSLHARKKDKAERLPLRALSGFYK